MIETFNLFEYANKTYKINKPIRLIELFAGIGSQAKSLYNLGVKFEHYKICEFDKYAVTAYNAIHNTNFEPSDITKIHAADLEIKETDKYCYIMTYSFPCQDLSIAGKMKGMKKGDGTRSGLLWEVERLLKEAMQESNLPQVLLMENVPQVINKKNIADFNEWLNFLTSIGYSSTYSLLNAKDYGIPQNRRRCFMVSILGNQNYVFPKGQPLKLKLKDLLEDEVNEKYFLSEEQVKSIKFSNYTQNQRRIQDKDVCDTLCARDWKDPKCVKVGDLSGGKWDKINESCRRVYSENGLSPTITTMGGGNQEPKVAIGDTLLIKEATLKGYKEATVGDGVDINRVEAKRGTVQKDMIQTLKANPSDVGVVVSNTICLNSKDEKGIQPSVQNRVYSDEGIATAVTTSFMPSYFNNLRIRKLTPLECWRLMGFDDDDFYKAKAALNKKYYNGRDKSNSRLYKMAGNSIVVDVLEAIFKKML